MTRVRGAFGAARCTQRAAHTHLRAITHSPLSKKQN